MRDPFSAATLTICVYCLGFFLKINVCMVILLKIAWEKRKIKKIIVLEII